MGIRNSFFRDKVNGT